MFDYRDRGLGDLGALRARVRPLVVRGLARVAPAERAIVRAVRGPDADALPALYETLRRTYAPRRAKRSQAPAASDVAIVRSEAVRAKVFADFFTELSREGDIAPAAVHTTRALIARAEPSRARSIAQVLQRYDELRPVADICLALCAISEPMPEPAWTLLTRNPLSLVLRWAPAEYFELGFRHDCATAVASLRAALDEDLLVHADPDVWLRIAHQCLAVQLPELADATLDHATAALPTVSDPARNERLGARLANLRTWTIRALAARRPVAAAAGEISIALVGFAHPDWSRESVDLADPIDAVSALGHLLRHDGVTFTGDDRLVSIADRLRRQMLPTRRLDGPRAAVRLHEVHRDTSAYAAVPDGTWVIVSEWLSQPMGGWRHDLPMDSRFRPIFLSFHITPDALAGAGVIAYLRQYGPIGCRDWDTVFLLLAAHVPAFFSGGLAATVDHVVAPHAGRATIGTLRLGDGQDGDGDQCTRMRPAMRDEDLARSLDAAVDLICGLRDSRAHVITSDLRSHLAARAVGCSTDFRPSDIGDYRVVDFLHLSDDEFAAMQRRISDQLAAVLRAVLAGDGEAQVYETWRDACADEVARAESELHSVTGDPELNFDLDEACRVIRSASVTIERRTASGAGAEINVEFSVDQNYRHQLAIVLDSVLERTDRPVRAFVLCRGLSQDDFDHLAEVFPTVSFVWLPTDNVQYGPIPGKIKWATVVTMDRTMLPMLLPEIDRMIHFDLDALCLGDLGELFDVEMDGTAIAAVDAPQPIYVGGLDTFRRAVVRLRREGRLDLARELIIRTHAQHEFDFEIFNAGIMVLDLAKMRADDVCRRYLGYIPRFGVNGQVIMNLYVGRDRAKVPADWNRLVRLEVADRPKVAHWAGPIKPWAGNDYVYGREWWSEQEEHFAATRG